ncbi:squalene/phytoene synthase family protein [Brevundimonas sp. Root1423]|uniref:squalene/phytoene synthase family protein n=1 Tax=Brevundimonas sp. Root1423 TaxID=1736462 RepID=UPI0006F84EF6|nr:squalene/phytoene synthase family protein [Brevundimonas sp. Root1423]KQY75098.1 squalene/phytoene synthase [Brevundimonas sp. Root1423]
MADPANSLDEQVRAADPDRWLSSRFVADERLRADLIALYAFEAELLAIPTRVTQPLLAEMRYVWWREQMDGVFAGVARKGHPVLEALTDIVARHGLDRTPFDALIEAHIGRVHGEPHDLDAFYTGPMQLAARVLGADNPVDAIPAGRVWGLMQTGRFDEARAALTEAGRAARALPVGAFPAVLPATLARSPEAGPTGRRLRLLWAAVRGRL